MEQPFLSVVMQRDTKFLEVRGTPQKIVLTHLSHAPHKTVCCQGRGPEKQEAMAELARGHLKDSWKLSTRSSEV